MKNVRTVPLPSEVFEAVRAGDVKLIRELRTKLRGDEVIHVKDTLPLFESMMAHMSSATAEERGIIEQGRQRVIDSTSVRPLTELLGVIEGAIIDSFEERIKKQSPAVYAMSKLLKGELYKTYDLPAEILPAVETRRVELLVLAHNRIKEGRLFSHEEARQILGFCIDYTNARFGEGLKLPSLNPSRPMDSESCIEIIKTLETVLNDIDFNERQGNGVYVADGQGRSRMMVRAVN